MVVKDWLRLCCPSRQADMVDPAAPASPADPHAHAPANKSTLCAPGVRSVADLQRDLQLHQGRY